MRSGLRAMQVLAASRLERENIAIGAHAFLATLSGRIGSLQFGRMKWQV